MQLLIPIFYLSIFVSTEPLLMSTHIKPPSESSTLPLSSTLPEQSHMYDNAPRGLKLKTSSLGRSSAGSSVGLSGGSSGGSSSASLAGDLPGALTEEDEFIEISKRAKAAVET